LLVDDDGVWLAALDEGGSGAKSKCSLLWMRLPGSGEPGTCLLALPKPVAVSGVSLDRVHRRLYFSLAQDMNDDIAFMRAVPR